MTDIVQRGNSPLSKLIQGLRPGLAQRPMPYLVWNLPALDVKHVPECGILILRGDAGQNAPPGGGWSAIIPPPQDLKWNRPKAAMGRDLPYLIQ